MKVRIVRLLSAGEVESGQEIPVRMPDESIVFLTAANPNVTADYGAGIIAMVDTEVGRKDLKRSAAENEAKAERLLRIQLQADFDAYRAAHP